MRRSIFVSIMVLGILTIRITSGYAKPGFGDDCTVCHISPVVQNFDIPLTYDSLTVPITDFMATDTDPQKASQAGVIGYLITESSAMPSASTSGWSGTPPESYTFTTPGSYTLYAWAKDRIGNVSTELVNASVYIEFGNNPPTENSPPVAVINLDQTAFTGNTVNLDGSGSSDPDGDPLTFQWFLGSVPAGSAAELSDPAIIAPTFVADIAGEYMVHLIVNDGMQDSTLDSVLLNVTLKGEPSPAELQVPDEGVTEEVSSNFFEDEDDDEVIAELDGNTFENDDNESNKSLSNENNRRLRKRHLYSHGIRWGRRSRNR